MASLRTAHCPRRRAILRSDSALTLSCSLITFSIEHALFFFSSIRVRTSSSDEYESEERMVFFLLSRETRVDYSLALLFSSSVFSLSFSEIEAFACSIPERSFFSFWTSPFALSSLETHSL